MQVARVYNVVEAQCICLRSICPYMYCMDGGMGGEGGAGGQLPNFDARRPGPSYQSSLLADF